jgi:hypothetical protein
MLDVIAEGLRKVSITTIEHPLASVTVTINSVEDENGDDIERPVTY